MISIRWPVRSAAALVAVVVSGMTLTGCHAPYTFGDFVWYDTDGDGIQDDGEPGVAGVLVRTCSYTGSSDYSCTTQRTNEDGRYVFRAPSNLIFPTYIEIRFEPPPGYLFTLSNQGDDDSVDSDGGGVELGPFAHGQPAYDDDTIDVGLLRADITVGDLVWNDVDRDGIQDPGEPGVAGVAAALLDPAGTVVDTAVSGDQGQYVLGPAPGGEYRVRFGPLPDGVTFTQPSAGTDYLLDSDVDPTTGETATRLFIEGAYTFVDAGLESSGPITIAGAIGDRVWRDLDGDGIQDPGEPGEPDVGVELRQDDFTMDETATDASGLYRFENLDPGVYQVRFVLPNGYRFTSQDQGLDDAADSDASSSGVTDSIDVRHGEVDTAVDAGLQLLG